MKCPYNRKSERHLQKWGQKYDDNQQPVSGLTTDDWEYEMADCIEADCGAWQNGRCCYASVNLNNQ